MRRIETGTFTDTACKSMINAAIHKCLTAWETNADNPPMSRIFDENFKQVEVWKKTLTVKEG